MQWPNNGGIMTDNTNIEACPCCSNRKVNIRSERDIDGCFWVFVECNACGLRTRGKWTSDESSIDANFYDEVRELWNRRAAISNAEPVARINEHSVRQCVEILDALREIPTGTELFLHPNVPAPLSEDRIETIQHVLSMNRIDAKGAYIGFDLIEFVRAIEAAHGIGLPLTDTGE